MERTVIQVFMYSQ